MTQKKVQVIINMFNISQLTNNDEYYTPKIAWQNIAHFLPRDKVIWECFYSPHSRSAEYLRELGFNCVYEPVDFFDKTPADLMLITTSPICLLV